MTTSLISIEKGLKIILVDLLFVILLYFIPTLSHIFQIPFYLFEPMRVALFATIIFTNNKTNSYILAFTLPLFSFCVGGHPVLLKTFMMAVELTINVWLFWKIAGKKVALPFAAFISIVTSKAIYYLIKYAVISWGMLEMSIISTPIWIQLVIAATI